MGQEKETTFRIDGKSFEGKALLETDAIFFRGEHRLVIKLASIAKVDAVRGKLRITHAGGVAEIDLGPQAEIWAEKIRNPKGRLDKLGVKAGSEVVLVGTFDDALRPELDARGAKVLTKVRPSGDHALIFFAAETKDALDRVPLLRRTLAPAGALWIVYPKGKKEIREIDVLEAGRAAKLTDHKVARFSETHTALKFVIRVSERGAALRKT